MPANLTIKNLPDSLYESLRASADRHHRSLNGEIIACLERVLKPRRIDVEERLARARALRAAARPTTAGQIARAIRQGRP
jgi:antitoxin FitA